MLSAAAEAGSGRTQPCAEIALKCFYHRDVLGIGCGYAGLSMSRRGPLNLMTFLGVVLLGIGGYYVWFARDVSRS